MKRLTLRFGVLLAVDVLLLTLCLRHLPSVFYRAAAPFEVTDVNGHIVVSTVTDVSSSDGILPGDRLIVWNALAIPAPEAMEFLGDQRSIGEKVTLTVERGEDTFVAAVTLVPYYTSPRFLIISIVVGLIIWGMAVFILWNAPPGFIAMVLHWTMIAFSVTILITLGSIRSGDPFSLTDRILFFVAYEGVAALFFFFTLLYPIQRGRSRSLLAVLTFLPASVLIIGMSYFQLADLQAQSLERFTAFQIFFDLFHVFLFVYVGGAVVNIIYSLRTATTAEERRKLQWIIWGLSLGASPFLFLHVLPQILFSRYFMAEEYATIFFLAIPFSFSMSFLKYRFLDIEFLINRSIVYTVLSVFIVVTFSLVFFLLTSAFGARTRYEEYLTVAGTALGLAFLFSPVRDRLQHLVDETLFAARANFRSAVRDLSGGLHRVLTSESLFQSLVDRLYGLIPARTIGAYRGGEDELRLAHRRGDDIPERISVTAEEREALAKASFCALRGAVEGARGTENKTGEAWLVKIGCSVCVSLTSDRGDLIGAVVLSRRAEQDRFREEEMDLLQTGCSQASGILGRLMLQERMFFEQEENKRLQELNELKSYFVSSVSHELRTPLTSIRMFAETLRLGRYSGRRQQREYLEIIEGESGRLGRLIGNVLDFAKIERGMKDYNLGPTDLRSVVRKVTMAMQYEFRSVRGKLSASVARDVPRSLRADADALEQLLINLLSNALKYSGTRKQVRLEVGKTGSKIVIKVSDAGFGIPAKEIPFIFQKFYRVRDIRSQQVGGAGLGLPLAKHIVESHGGEVAVKSRVGQGSTFIVKLPISHENRSHRRR
ncbi:MAG: hypothetical protein HYW57_04450 [Ignavibacteriales bacterium]|nr:hypothetical protein [Ignavibacteriales bacterium]